MAVLLVAGCTGQPPTAPADVTASATEPPVPGGRVVTAQATDIRTLQPILVTDAPSGRLVSLLYDELVSPDPQNGEPRPNLAKFEVSSDGKIYSFEIDAEANWSDGKPVVADDWYVTKKLVALSKVTVRKSLFQDIVGWKEFLPASETNPTGGTATEISGVKIDAANPKKFDVTVASVSCPALFNLASYVLPAHVFGKYAAAGQADAIDKAPENTAPTVFSGPFKFKEWRQGDQVILTRNDTYWKGAPLVDEFVYKVVADVNVTAAQLKTGEVNLGSIEPKDLADFERQSHLRVHRYQALGYTYIGWRTDSQTVPALRDKRVRQALAYGLDMDAVIKAVLFGEGTRQVAHHVPVQWAYPDPKTLNQYPYDQAKAEDLLKQAGYAKGPDGIYAKDGKPISFTISTGSGSKTFETLAQVASEQYKAIGIEAKTSFEAFQGLVTKLTTGQAVIDAVIIAWSLGPEPDPYSIWHSSQIPDPATKKTGFGFTGFRNAEIDKAIEEGRNPTNGDCTVETRKKHYETMNKILNEQQPYNFGFSGKVSLVTSADLQGFAPGSFGQVTYNIHEWWFRGTR